MGRDDRADRLASLMMGLWRSMARSPGRCALDDEDEGLVLLSMLGHMAVEAWEAHEMSIRFMLWSEGDDEEDRIRIEKVRWLSCFLF